MANDLITINQTPAQFNNISGTTLIRLQKLKSAENERAQLIGLARDVMFNPVVELIGGVAIAEYMQRKGLFGSGFSSWLEAQGLELALAAIIGLQAAAQNPQGVKAISESTGGLLGGLVKAFV